MAGCTIFKNVLTSYSWYELTHSMTVIRGCPIKKFTNVLLHAAKMIDPRVKSQARGQKNRSRALKWDIVHLWG